MEFKDTVPSVIVMAWIVFGFWLYFGKGGKLGKFLAWVWTAICAFALAYYVMTFL